MRAQGKVPKGRKNGKKCSQITHIRTKYDILVQRETKTRDREWNLQGSRRVQAAVTHQVHTPGSQCTNLSELTLQIPPPHLGGCGRNTVLGRCSPQIAKSFSHLLRIKWQVNVRPPPLDGGPNLICLSLCRAGTGGGSRFECFFCVFLLQLSVPTIS